MSDVTTLNATHALERSEVRTQDANTDLPPSVALVSTQRHWHGGESQAALLADGLRARGGRCLIVARREGLFAQRMSLKGHHVITFRGRGRTPRALLRIRQAVRMFRPDVLHFNDPHAMTSAGVATLGMQFPTRVVSRRVDFKISSARWYHWLSDGVICVSRAVSGVCRDGGIDATCLHLVHDGVDPTRLCDGNADRARARLHLSPATRLLLNIGKLTDHKGHRYLLAAMPAVAASFPDVRLLIAGQGELRGELEQQVRRLGLESVVQFLGYRDDIADLMAAAELLVIPSHMEGLCSTIIDAMLVGCPVVATAAGGIPDLFEKVQSSADPLGWLVPTRDPTALAQAIVAALQDDVGRRQVAANARAHAQRQFTAEQMVERTIDVYREVIAQAGRSRASNSAVGR